MSTTCFAIQKNLDDARSELNAFGSGASSDQGLAFLGAIIIHCADALCSAILHVSSEIQHFGTAIALDPADPLAHAPRAPEASAE